MTVQLQSETSCVTKWLDTLCDLVHAIRVNPITKKPRKLNVQGRILGYLAYTCNLDESLVADMSDDLGVVCTKPKMTYKHIRYTIT